MNTKKRNIGARLGALLLSLCLLVGLLPTTTFAAETDPFIFGYKSGAPIISVSTTNQSDYTKVADYDDSLLGLEIINGTIYGLSCDHYFYTSKLVILNPDFTIRNTVGSWFNENFVIVDTAVQNGTQDTETAEQKSPIRRKCRRTCEAGLNLSKRQVISIVFICTTAICWAFYRRKQLIVLQVLISKRICGSWTSCPIRYGI